MIAPLSGLIVVLVATAFYYSVNTSDSVDTLQSWSCRWVDIDMDDEPHFDKVCKETQAALYLTIIMIPLEVIVLALGGLGFLNEKKARNAMADRKSSPTLS